MSLRYHEFCKTLILFGVLVYTLVGCGSPYAIQEVDGGCEPITCLDEGAECGSLSDGCGGNLDCGTCSGSLICGVIEPNLCGDACPSQLDCADYPGVECGVVSDGCGGTIDLVSSCSAVGCTAPEICNGGGAGVTQCGTGACTPSTCANFPGAECGTVGDGCGGVIDLVVDCGSAGCTSPETCGGGGVANECGGCVPLSCADFPTGECGSVADGCGGTIDLVAVCGVQGCTAPDTCGGGGAANQCGGGCTPLLCADFPADECGAVPDGCGGTIDLVTDCGATGCTAPDTCGGGGTANQCGSGCILLDCVDFPAAECGTVPDGCGGTIDLVADCGASGCTAPDVCGGSGNPAGHAIFCGDPCPSRRDCNFTNSSFYECGVVSDNCGGTIDMVADCGAPGCGTNQVCAPSSWGYLECITGSCTPLGCADFPGLECGLVNDGCGGVLDLEASCGLSGCLAPEICGGGAVGPNRCGDPTCPFPRRTCADYAGLIAGAVASGDPLCGVISDGCGGILDLVADCGAPGCGSCLPGTPLAPQCSTFPRPSDPLDSKICLENVSGCPGEIVDMELHVIVPTTCANGATSQRSIGIVGHGFELLNPVGGTCGVENCIRRDVWQGNIGWIQFNGQAIGCSTGQCPNELPTGHVDTVQLRIPVNQLSGDHALQLDSTGAYIANPCDVCPGTWCEANQPAGMAPTARVY